MISVILQTFIYAEIRSKNEYKWRCCSNDRVYYTSPNSGFRLVSSFALEEAITLSPARARRSVQSACNPNSVVYVASTD